jgi:predicted secreted hydrolase
MALLRALRCAAAAFTILLACGSAVTSPANGQAASQVDSHFPDAPHADALIEWWYANAHVTTAHRRHLAVVCAFFKFGNATQQSATGIPPSHYLIYSVTDLDRKTQRAYSYADSAMADGLKKLFLVSGASDSKSIAMLHALLKGRVPAPHRMITGKVGIETSPLSVKYGDAGSFSAVPGVENAYHLVLGKDHVDVTLTSTKPVMRVGGSGETGLVKPTDMYYYSLTRCSATGMVDGDFVKSGKGWIDHQWGSSWTTQKFGWDWWGVQLDNGTDILVFQQRNLSTGRAFYPLATFMDKDGNLTVTHKIVFRPVPGSTWRSPRGHARYPLAWDVSFPEQDLSLRITADVKNQEIPILSPSGDIWEGSCTVVGIGTFPLRGIAQRGVRDVDQVGTAPVGPLSTSSEPGTSEAGSERRARREGFVRGTAYMELVGYSRTMARKQAR